TFPSTDSIENLGDVIDAINDQTAGDVTASVNPDGTGLQLVDNTGTGGLAITDLNSKAATDLGLTIGSTSGDTLTGSRVVAAMNSKLLRNLNGGDGVAAGAISVTNSAGATTSIDLSAARSVSEVLDAINDAGAGVTASLNEAGNGIELIDDAGGTGDLVIEEDGSTTAADLGLAGTFTDGRANSGNLQFRYVTNNTSLEDLGVRQGKFLIRDANGNSATIDLTQNESSIGEVIREINGITNALGVEVEARINENGDGIELLDTATDGASGILVQGVEGSTAEDLGILGTAENPGDSISGSFEQSIEITDTDTLEDVVQKINDAGVGVSAGIINDGAAGNSFRLSLTSRDSGSDSAFVFDDGGMGFGARNFSEARDAVVFFGADAANSLALTSTSNRLEDVIPGVDVDLKSVSEQPVQLTINRDTEAITSAAESFVESFNSLVDAINKYDSYDEENEERGLLLGDSTVARIRSSVYNAVINPNREIPGQFDSLSEVGIRVGEGAKLEFNSDKFLAAFAEDPEGVEQLFTFKQTEENADGEEEIIAQGIGREISELLKDLTDAQGPLQRRVNTIEGQVQLNKDRIEAIEDSVEAKQERLEREFTQMELALAQIQDQQSALSQLANLASGGGGGNPQSGRSSLGG
ncbi:MAG: flagellar filament capping protein FliD, partial [Phycisphaeraceae bacterium]